MAAPQNFRSAFNGFNRDDVVNYISYLTTKHESQVNQLLSEIEQLRQELAERPEVPAVDEKEVSDLREQVIRLQAQLSERDETVARLRDAASAAAPVMSISEQELSAYRRAESAERRAMERVSQMYAKANGVLADTVARLDANTAQISRMAEQVRAGLEALDQAVAESKDMIGDCAGVIRTMHPEE
jgi:chromosome segregation ATPase